SLQGEALQWYANLDPEVQENWKLLQRALLAKCRPTFRGNNGVECDEFVQAVRQRAIAEGKEFDNEWMAKFASTCIAGEALRWYTRLDKTTKHDWDLLQTALFNQYPTPNLLHIENGIQYVYVSL
ncbi:hypothetical protein FRB99_008383, partial [Tulasnella sp. 403]